MKNKQQTIEEIVDEFNPLGSNDGILGRYGMALVKAIRTRDRNLIDELNVEWDNKINNWLTQKLQQVDQNAREEEREKFKEVLETYSTDSANCFNIQVAPKNQILEALTE